MMRLPRRLSRIASAPSMWVFGFVVALAIFSNLSSSQALRGSAARAEERPTVKEMDADKSLLREGSTISESRGQFKIDSERVLFVGESLPKPVLCLENLMLERVHRFLVDDEGNRQRWVVTGKITEFDGRNFLWVDRAVRAQ